MIIFKTDYEEMRPVGDDIFHILGLFFAVSRPWGQRFTSAIRGVIQMFILLVLPDL